MSDEPSEKIEPRTKAYQIAPGKGFKVGNPGKPLGARHKRTILQDSLFEAKRLEIAQVIIDGALARDANCLQIASSFYNFKRKGRPVPFALPEVNTVGGVVEALALLVKAVSRGELSAEEAHDYEILLDAQRKCLETHELAARISALEAEAGAT